ncbi:ribosome maturation factor RimM [Nocardioides sp. Y6]|uniref:Ribosome maturation factor RimM n=1 Tax=Nocardioides malaquae TaxID=2773426 RepID=A0ABR9RP69_9ACTN|nr:ribosome maturation factor RimM [Nocardioides malaquae]
MDVVVGRIGKPHGIRGEVTVEVRTDEPDARFAVGSTIDVVPPKGSTAPWRTLTVRTARWHQSVLLLGFEEWADRNTAESARGILLQVTLTEEDVPTDPDEFYDHQLAGLEVRNLDGEVIGEVSNLVPGAAQDLLRVRATDGRDTLVPFVRALVPEVDVAGGFVVVADRPGLVAPFPDDAED